MYGITHSMSRAGAPTDNVATEAINSWIKAELFTDFHLTGDKPVNEERLAYALDYLTPKQYREQNSPTSNTTPSFL